MKRFRNLLVLGLAIAAFSFTSCKKDYTCTCTFTYDDGVTTATDISYTIPDATKSDAETACEGYIIDVAGVYTMACELE